MSNSRFLEPSAGVHSAHVRCAAHILETDIEPLLASVAASCSSVIVCRASPSQKVPTDTVAPTLPHGTDA